MSFQINTGFMEDVRSKTQIKFQNDLHFIESSVKQSTGGCGGWMERRASITLDCTLTAGSLGRGECITIKKRVKSQHLFSV